MINLDSNTLQPIVSKIDDLQWYLYENNLDYLLIFLINEKKIQEDFLIKLIKKIN